MAEKLIAMGFWKIELPPERLTILELKLLIKEEGIIYTFIPYLLASLNYLVQVILAFVNTFFLSSPALAVCFLPSH